MFESITRRERPGTTEVVLVVAVAAVAFAAQLVLLRGTVKPLATAIEEIRAPRQVIPRDALPEFVEEIVVVAPYRPRPAVLLASGAQGGEAPAWVAPQYGICPAR